MVLTVGGPGLDLADPRRFSFRFGLGSQQPSQSYHTPQHSYTTRIPPILSKNQRGMDEAFWSSVVKRWSDASENVIKLRKEVAKLEEEVSSTLLCLHLYICLA